MEFLRPRDCTLNDLFVIIDSTASQNKKKYFFACLAIISAKQCYVCKNVRTNVLCVGLINVSPYTWLSPVKSKSKNIDINAVLNVEEIIQSLAVRQRTGALGLLGHAPVLLFING